MEWVEERSPSAAQQSNVQGNVSEILTETGTCENLALTHLAWYSVAQFEHRTLRHIYQRMLTVIRLYNARFPILENHEHLVYQKKQPFKNLLSG